MLYHLYVNIQMFIFVYIYIYIASWICKQIRLFTMHRLCQSIVNNAQVIDVFDIYRYTYTGPNVYVNISLLKLEVLST